MRAIDFHVHLPTVEWIEGCLGPYRESTEAYFRKKVDPKRVEEVAEEFEKLDLLGVVLGWDAETATGLPGLSNDEVASIQRRFPERFVAFAGIDPHKPTAVAELERSVRDLGMKGGKLHPSIQAFDPSQERFFPLWSAAESLGVPLVFHTGTSGIGAGAPGGQGIRIDLAHPLLLDPVAAQFPLLQIVMAHFGWPWHLDAIAMALHKANVYLDVSGWAPRYIPEDVVREMRGRLSRKFVWGSDYPFLDPARCLEEIEGLQLGESAESILVGNAARLLKLE